jgi:cyanophycinase
MGIVRWCVPFLLCFLCLFVTNPIAETETRAADGGALFLVGGGVIDQPLRDRFITLAGGPDALIVIIPSASKRQEAGKESKEAWEAAGAKNVHILHASSPEEANQPECYRVLKKANAVWLGGGDQADFMKIYRGTFVEKELMNLHRRGGVIGGTSAGASVVTGVMVYEDSEDFGLNILPNVIVDQHFDTRKRLPRLRSLVNKHQCIGLGLDESTAVEINKGKFTVIGRKSVTFLRPDTDPVMYTSGKGYAVVKR